MEKKGNNGIFGVKSVANFKKSLAGAIESFERAREWADLSNCLQKVKKYFD